MEYYAAEENYSKKQKICNDSGISDLANDASFNDSQETKENSLHNDTNEDYEESLWWTIPDLVLLKILSYLTVKDVASVAATCRRWYEVANDDLMWKHRFQKHFRTDPAIPLKPGMYICDLVFLRPHTYFTICQGYLL